MEDFRCREIRGKGIPHRKLGELRHRQSKEHTGMNGLVGRQQKRCMKECEG